MRNDKHLATKLRKQGLSYSKISKELDIPKSTISNWFSSLDWSSVIKDELNRKANYIAKKRLRLVNRKRKQMWEEWRESARQEAREEFDSLSQNSLFVAGLMLYWGEGDSKIENSIVRLVNTNPDMLRIFSIFLQEVCNVPRIKLRVGLTLYPDLDETQCMDHWSKITEIPKNQFVKTQVISGKHPTKRLSYGMCTIYITSRQFKEKLFVWIDLFQKNIKSAGIV